MKKQLWQGLCLAVAVFACAGCSGGHESEPTGKEAQANLIVDAAHSAYPYFKLVNQGATQADQVTVAETKSQESVSVLALQTKDGQTVPAGETVRLKPGDSAHYQMRSQDVREFTVRWVEDGVSFEKNVQLKEPQKIETH